VTAFEIEEGVDFEAPSTFGVVERRRASAA